MNGEVSRAALQEVLRDMRTELREGFDAVNTRLDELNGRTRKGEIVEAEHQQKIRNLERQVFTDNRGHELEKMLANALAQHSGSSVKVTAEMKDGGARRITERDVRLVILGGGGAFALFKAGEWLFHLLKGLP